MLLADTSIWIEHFRGGNVGLAETLASSTILIHPFIVGELSCGNLHNRSQVFADLNALPRVTCASTDEVLRLVENRRLWGKGLGWIDCHLLASALIANCQLWTLDKALLKIAREIGIARA